VGRYKELALARPFDEGSRSRFMALPLPATSVLPILALLTRPHLTATRVSQPPVLDGKLDDPAWKEAVATEAFTQKFPDEGKAPSERTTLRIVYDDEAVYVAFDCEQIHSPVVERLTRRGRLVESDWVSVALGTRGDGRSAYEFLVNASGVRVDALRFNDTDKTEDRDENWDAQTARTPHGWSAEFKIPLHILRFADATEQAWDLEARRYVSERQETDEWAFFPRNVGGEVSHYGKLDGLRGLTSKTPVELRPFVVGKVEHRDPSSSQLSSGTSPSASAGLDLKWHPAYDLTLDLTVNPDFAQVEADQLVLNLSNFETWFPEKRPFFYEGTDIFATPFQLLYTRRIGRAPDSPRLRDDFGEELVAAPDARPIYLANKLTGRIADGWSVGTLQAITGKSEVNVQLGDETTRVRRLVEPLSAYQVLRLKRDIGDNAYVGVTGTATTYIEPAGAYPLVPPGPDSPTTTQLCPNGVDIIKQYHSVDSGSRSGPASFVRPHSRCFDDAFVGALDGNWRSSEGTWVASGQAALSTLRGGPPRHVADGTFIQPGDVGTGVKLWAAKEGGDHWLGNVGAEYMSRSFDINDLGFLERANTYGARGQLQYRELEHWGPFLESHVKLEAFDRHNLDGILLERGYELNGGGRLSNFWHFGTGVWFRPRAFDDREVGDGTTLERARRGGQFLWMESDRTKVVSFEMGQNTELVENGWNAGIDAGVLFRVLPAFDLTILPTASYTVGEPRFAGMGDGAQAGQYVFGRLTAKSIGSTLRATYTFTPRLTLQAYAQVLLASGHYGEFSSLPPAPGGARTIAYLDRLVPLGVGRGGIDNPDFFDAALNLNVVLRWEYRLGSIAYLVYTRSQSSDAELGPNEPARLGFKRPVPAVDVLLLKVSYWWG
jgi:hypothetical protein